MARFPLGTIRQDLLLKQGSQYRFEQITEGYFTGGELILGGEDSILRSANFVSGASGWRIDGVGNAEFNDITVRGDIVSGNWSSGGGTEPLALSSRDTGATTGFGLDSSEGAAQFAGSVWIDGALEVRGTTSLYSTLTMETGSVFRTDEGDDRVEITGTDLQKITFYEAGLAAAELRYNSGATTFDVLSDNQDLYLRAGISGSTHYNVVLAPDSTAMPADWGQVLLNQVGDASKPALAWATDSDTGFARTGGDQVSIANGGNEVVRIQNAGSLAFSVESSGNYWFNGGQLYNWDSLASGTDVAQPFLKLKSKASGDNWTSQGAYITMGEGAGSGNATALQLSYSGDGLGRIGMGSMDTVSFEGEPANAYIEFHWNQDRIRFNIGHAYEMVLIANNLYPYTNYGLSLGTSSNKWNIGYISTTRLDNGSAGTPTHSFVNDTNSGMYRRGADEVAISTGGGDRLIVGGSTYMIVTNSTLNDDDPRLQSRGSESAPAYSFRGDTDLGIYRNSANLGALTANADALYWRNGGSSSSIYFQDGLTDVGNHETLRLNRGTGTTMQQVGYYSSWLDTKTDIKGLDDERNPWWKREWFMDLDPISSRKKKVGHFRGQEDMRTISFYMENLIEHTNLLTTKGIRVGDSPDEMAILAVTVDYVQFLEKRTASLEERVVALEEKIAALT